MTNSAPKFVSPAPLPTPRERELLTILIEECAEVQQRATKLLRFGKDEIQPGQPLTNAERLGEEIGDLSAMVKMLTDCGVVPAHSIIVGQVRKPARVEKYLQSPPDEPPHD